MKETNHSFSSSLGFIARIHEMTMQSGSDAQTCLRSLYQQCVELAPSVLLIDPLQEIAASNPSKPINRSDVDSALLSEFHAILENAKQSGVTIIGVVARENTTLPRVTRAFDETIEFFIPSQHDRARYFRYVMDGLKRVNVMGEKEDNGGSGVDEWKEQFCNYLSLHS